MAISRLLTVSAAFLTTCALLSPAHGAAAAAAALPAGKVESDKPAAAPGTPAKPAPKVSSLSPAVRDAAKKIDELVAAGYADQKLTAGRLTTDDEFLRRAYLDITGAIPNYEQAKAFLDSKDPSKRAKLIDELLDSPGYVSHMYNYWADLLRINNRTRGDYAGNYPQWVKESIKKNLPFDLFVYEMITAEGKAKDNGAVGYWLRDDGMVLEITSTTAQVFLGTQIGCAQCHDHPFDSWEQKQFYELAAFTSQVSTRDGARGNTAAMREIRKKITSGELPREVQQVVQNLVREASYGVTDQPRKNLKLPNDYKYDNGKPGQVVSAHVIFGQEPPPAKELSARERYARWLISPQNPLFTQVIANRMWAKVFGIGIVNPVDDFNDNNKPLNPALLAHLTETMKGLRYDLKEYLRIVLNTRTYQLATNREDYNKENFKHQAGVLRRMTAEQLWDSFITLVVEDPNAHIGEDGYGAGGMMAMMMMGGDDVDISKMTADEIIKYAEKVIEDRKTNRRDAGRAAMQRRGGGGPGMARASEIRQPAPPGHFLREFGGSGRETVADAHTDPSVPQVLYLLNGPSFMQLISRNSELSKNLAKAKDDKAKVETLYLTILSRYPTPTEMAIAMKELKASATKGVENLTWALINTREFIFIR